MRNASEMGSIDAEKLAAALAAAPRRPTLARRLAPVLHLIQSARDDGVTWSEISATLAEAGIAMADGRPVPPSMLTRAMRRLSSRPVPETRREPVQRMAPAPSGETAFQRVERERREREAQDAAKPDFTLWPQFNRSGG